MTPGKCSDTWPRSCGSRAGASSFGVMELWLAAQAVQRRFHLLTFNEKHFKDIPGLDLVVLPHP